MKKTRMPQRLLSLVLVLMMLISVLPVSAMAAELTPSDPETGLTATDVTNELTDSDRLAIFEENMDSSKVSRSEIPADDEMVKVIVQLDADSLLDVRNRTNASMSMLDFQQTDAAKAQLKDIANLQLSVMNTMESKGIPSSFTFSYTSVVSGFAAQVPYGKIHDIKNIDGVEDVVLCQTYYTDSMGSATLGQALTAAEVAAYSNNTQYQGEGMLIGILDTGLDVNHEAFANAPAVQKLQKSSLSKLLYQISQGEDGKTNVTAYSYAALWYAQKHSSSSLVLLTEDDLYKSGKVPFAFDYADADADVIPSADAVEKYGNDHGTHVAGITAGKTVDADGSVTFAGQSPEAQLAIFKVFSDSTNGASTDTILAALNDALLLDVDVINMSLGSNGGFGREAEGDLTTKYYDLVKSAGILLNCSAGNSYSSSQGGARVTSPPCPTPTPASSAPRPPMTRRCPLPPSTPTRRRPLSPPRAASPIRTCPATTSPPCCWAMTAPGPMSTSWCPTPATPPITRAWTLPARSPWSCAAACPSSRSSSMPPLPVLRAASSITTATAIC